MKEPFEPFQDWGILSEDLLLSYLYSRTSQYERQWLVFDQLVIQWSSGLSILPYTESNTICNHRLDLESNTIFNQDHDMLVLCQPLWSTSLIEEQLWFSEHDRDVDLWCWIIVACQPPCNQRFLSEFAQQWSSQGGWILNCLGNIQIQLILKKRDFPLLRVDLISTLHSTGSHHQFPRKSGFLSNVAIQLRLNGTFCCALIFEQVNISFPRLSRSVKIE